jgi:steroid delta-isomerase-like uncharacterized protein
MSEQANKDNTARFYEEVFNKHSIEAVDELIHDDFREHVVLPPGMSDDKKGALTLFEQWFAAVPDLAATIDDMIASGDKVFVRSTISGTQTGEFLGMPPTGKSFSIGSMDIVRIQDDQAIEHWGIQDTMAMMTQLGLMPPPAGGEHDH